jgi:hypothetical protein
VEASDLTEVPFVRPSIQGNGGSVALPVGNIPEGTMIEFKGLDCQPGASLKGKLGKVVSRVDQCDPAFFFVHFWTDEESVKKIGAKIETELLFV